MTSRKLILASLMASVVLPIGQSPVAQNLALEEIVVTARKRDESIYEIPVSVTAFSQAQLDRAGIDNPDDLAKLVPGLDFHGTTATAGRYNPQVRFRGMNQQIITPSTQIAAVFWDGSFIGAGSGFLPLGDLERVEIIKGPQTAYFGRNTFSGAVNYIPKLPGDEWEGDISLDWSPSQHDEFNVNGGVGGPISDRVGIRVWAGYQQEAGDFKFEDGGIFGVQKDTSISGTVTYDAFEDLRLKFTGYYTNANDAGTNAGVGSRVFGTPAGQCNITYTGEYLNPATGERTPFTRDLSTLPFASWCGQYPDGEGLAFGLTRTPTDAQLLAGGAARRGIITALHPLLEKYGILKTPNNKIGGQNRTYRLQFGGEYDIGDHTLSFQVSRSNTGTVNSIDFSYGVPFVPGTVFLVGNDIAIRETYYEARIASPQDQRLRYLIGVSDYTQRYRLGQAPLTTQLTPGTFPTVDFQDNITTAVFGSLDYDIADDLTFSAEVRYTDEETQGILQGNPNAACGFSPTCNLVDKYDDFIPRVILSYTPFEGATTYASYSYSSLLGVATQAGFVNSVAPEVIPADQLAALGLFTDPQENEQFELGWKQQTEQWAFTLAVFHIDWKNQPFASVILLPAGGTTSFRGPGDSKYKGFDFEFNGNPTEWLNISGSLAYTDAKMVSFSSRGSNESSVLGSGALSVVNDGNEPRNTPRWTASLSPTFLGELGDREWFLRGDFFYQSAVWADYSEFNRTGTSFRINARFGIDLTEESTIEFYGSNLTNDKFLPNTNGTTTGPGGSRKAFVTPYRPREFGVRLSAQF